MRDLYQLGSEGGSGDLVICTITHMHIKTEVMELADRGFIDPYKMDLVARHGWNWYVREREGLFDINRPMHERILGWDGLPDYLKDSKVLSGNNLGRLALIDAIPREEDVEAFLKQEKDHMLASIKSREDAQRQAIKYLDVHEIRLAWLIILASEKKLG
ncbi:MAG: hypothetical protein ACOCZ8_04470 [Bacteroidota bacterium]